MKWFYEPIICYCDDYILDQTIIKFKTKDSDFESSSVQTSLFKLGENIWQRGKRGYFLCGKRKKHCKWTTRGNAQMSGNWWLSKVRGGGWWGSELNSVLVRGGQWSHIGFTLAQLRTRWLPLQGTSSTSQSCIGGEDSQLRLSWAFLLQETSVVHLARWRQQGLEWVLSTLAASSFFMLLL